MEQYCCKRCLPKNRGGGGGLGQTTPVDNEVKGYNLNNDMDTRVITDIVAPMQTLSQKPRQLADKLLMTHAGNTHLAMSSSNWETDLTAHHADTPTHLHSGFLPEHLHSPNTQGTRLNAHQPTHLPPKSDRGQSNLFVLQYNTQEKGLHKEAKHLVETSATLPVSKLVVQFCQLEQQRASVNFLCSQRLHTTKG